MLATCQIGSGRRYGCCGGWPGGTRWQIRGIVVVQDAAELMNNLLRDNLANQRLFRWVQFVQTTFFPLCKYHRDCHAP
jgi:hypothetical protein